jgi:gas vesicle protein
LSEKGGELAERMRELHEQSTLADAQKIEIDTLKTQVEALEDHLEEAGQELKAVEDGREAAVHEVQHALSAKESDLAERIRELNECSNFADAQKIEITTLKSEIEALQDRLDGATKELKAVEDPRRCAA